MPSLSRRELAWLLQARALFDRVASALQTRAPELLHANLEVEPSRTMAIHDARTWTSALAERPLLLLCQPSLGAPQHRLVLELDAFSALALLQAFLGEGGEVLSLPSALEASAQGALLYFFLRLFEPEQEWRVLTLLSTRLAATPLFRDEELVSCSALFQMGAQRGFLRSWMPVRFLEEQTRRPPPEPAWPEALECWGGLRRGYGLELGRVELSAAEWASVEVGDVVLLDECWWRSDDRLRGHWRGSAACDWWQRKQGKWCLAERSIWPLSAEAEEMTREAMTREHEAIHEADEAWMKALGETRIELGVEVARLRLSLAALLRLQRGDVLPTGVRIGNEVTLIAGEQRVARGELVDVEGEIGVKITERIGAAHVRIEVGSDAIPGASPDSAAGSEG